MDLDNSGAKPFMVFICVVVAIVGLTIVGTLIWDRYKISSWERDAKNYFVELDNETKEVFNNSNQLIQKNNELATLRNRVNYLERQLKTANKELSEYRNRETSVLGTSGTVKRIVENGEVRYVESVQ